jgi:transposase-like protein
MSGAYWTPEEDRILEEGLAAGRTVVELATELGRSPIGLRHRRRRLGKERLHRPWTPEREAQLIQLMEDHRSWPEIGRIMGNSPKYLQMRAVEAGLSLRTANGYPMGEVARMMGVDDHTVTWWIQQRWLRAHRTRQALGRGFLTMVEHDDLVRFLENEDYWPIWDPARITKAPLREWATELRGDLRFYTTGQAAPLLFITPLGLQKAIREGRVRAIKVGSRWYIRSDWLTPMPLQKRPKQKAPRLSGEDVALITVHWGRIPAEAIAKRLGRDRATAVHHAAKRLGLPPVGRGYWKRQRAEERKAVNA